MLNGISLVTAAEQEMTLEYVAAVVITGIVVVFICLILLIIFISLLGLLFKKKDKKKTSPENTIGSKEDLVKISMDTPKATPQTASFESSDADDEIIAVITAAIAAMSEQSGKKLVLRSVRAVKPSRLAWAQAGLADNTRPF